MDVLQQNNDIKCRFYIMHEGAEIATMHYNFPAANKIIIDHTEVAEAYEGKGLGKQLLQALVAYARKEKITVIPLCPFAKGMFDRIEAFRDVLA